MATLRPKFDKIAREYDAIIIPSCAGEAPKKEEFNPKTRFCGLWTALHEPVVAVPGFAGSCGLPIGLSLVGPRYVGVSSEYCKLTPKDMVTRSCCRLPHLSQKYLGSKAPDGRRGKRLSLSTKVGLTPANVCFMASLPDMIIAKPYSETI
jgi:hypothetical protein